MYSNEQNSIPIPDGTLQYDSHFLPSEEAADLLGHLVHNIDWRQEEMKMFGKVVPFPRLTAWYGDPEASYRYSGTTFQPTPWIPELLSLREKIQDVVNHPFNSVLLNYYRDGQDSMGWHADNEKELGRNPVIASLNLGASRPFQLKHNTLGDKQEIILEHGSLLIMAGALQHHWKHQIPKRKKIQEPRINLTFRQIL
jgi:alkylated DNA repair dioxygenase AlkB